MQWVQFFQFMNLISVYVESIRCVCVNKAHEFQSCFKVSLNTHITYVTYVYKYLQIKLQLKTIIHWCTSISIKINVNFAKNTSMHLVIAK